MYLYAVTRNQTAVYNLRTNSKVIASSGAPSEAHRSRIALALPGCSCPCHSLPLKPQHGILSQKVPLSAGSFSVLHSSASI